MARQRQRLCLCRACCYTYMHIFIARLRLRLPASALHPAMHSALRAAAVASRRALAAVERVNGRRRRLPTYLGTTTKALGHWGQKAGGGGGGGAQGAVGAPAWGRVRQLTWPLPARRTTTFSSRRRPSSLTLHSTPLNYTALRPRPARCPPLRTQACRPTLHRACVDPMAPSSPQCPPLDPLSASVALRSCQQARRDNVRLFWDAGMS